MARAHACLAGLEAFQDFAGRLCVCMGQATRSMDASAATEKVRATQCELGDSGVNLLRRAARSSASRDIYLEFLVH